MNVNLAVKPSFTVIGKLGRGPSGESSVWIPPLWKAVTDGFPKIAGLVKLRPDGRPIAVWGAMSDVGMNFRRWDSEGLYLAGCEAKEGAEPPEGFVKWEIPGFKYITARCSVERSGTADSYGEVFYHVLNEYMPSMGYTLAGAVQELYSGDPESRELELYFPVERL